MANTVNQNIIVPEVYAQLVREKVAGKCKVAQFLVNLGDLHGKVGETLTMPKWAYIGDAVDWDIATPMDKTQMLALNIYDTFYGRRGFMGVGQAKAVIFFVIVAGVALIQLRATRSREVQQ